MSLHIYDDDCMQFLQASQLHRIWSCMYASDVAPPEGRPMAATMTLHYYGMQGDGQSIHWQCGRPRSLGQLQVANCRPDAGF